MRITEIRECTIPISRYSDPAIRSGMLTTSVVAITTDVFIDGKAVVGYGHASIGRFAQGGLMRERFLPRLLNAEFGSPREAWEIGQRGEKAGGHGDRSVAAGALDMAVWDAFARSAQEPLYRFIAKTQHRRPSAAVAAYAGGGYVYPDDDLARLKAEIDAMLAMGFSRVKIKIGALPLERDLRRVEAAIEVLGDGSLLAVDAMNAYDRPGALKAAHALKPYGLWWFEDVCDPLDFDTLAHVADRYEGPIAAGEALFSLPEARLLDSYGGLRRDRDILLFDPIHCGGLTHFLEIVKTLEERGWPRSAFWPHGGHSFTAHVVAGLDLGGAECNPFAFAPLGAGLPDLGVSASAAAERQTVSPLCPQAMP